MKTKHSNNAIWRNFSQNDARPETEIIFQSTLKFWIYKNKFLLKNSWNQRFNFSYQKITSDTNSLTTWEIIFRNIPMTRKKRSLKNSGTKNYYHTKNPGIRTKTDFEQCQKKTTPPWSNLTFENSGFWTNKWMTKTLTLASIGVSFQSMIPASNRKRRNEEVNLKLLFLIENYWKNSNPNVSFN